jgi:arylamine N-acetyltransferase
MTASVDSALFKARTIFSHRLERNVRASAWTLLSVVPSKALSFRVTSPIEQSSLHPTTHYIILCTLSRQRHLLTVPITSRTLCSPAHTSPLHLQPHTHTRSCHCLRATRIHRRPLRAEANTAIPMATVPPTETTRATSKSAHATPRVHHGTQR